MAGGCCLTNDPQYSFTSFGNARCIAANGDVVHIVWYSGDTVGVNGWEIFYNRSADKGATWGTPVRLSNAGLMSYNPAIAVSAQPYMSFGMKALTVRFNKCTGVRLTAA